MTFGSAYTTQTAIFPANAVIKIERKDTGSIYTITTQVFNYEESGGGKETESIAHFGNAFIKIKKPQEDFEVNLDVSMRDPFWHSLVSDNVTDIRSDASGSLHFLQVVSDGNQDDFKIKIEWTNPDNNGSEGFKVVYYNATAVQYNKSSAADDRLIANVSFRIPPTSAFGSGLKYEFVTANRYAADIGSKLTGSYGAYEKTADVLFGYSPGSML